MKIAIAHTKTGPKHDYLFACLKQGLEAHGDTVTEIYNHFEINKIEDHDVAFMFSMPFIAHKHKEYYGFTNEAEIKIPYQNFRLAIFEWAKRNGKRFLPIDSGSIAFDRVDQDTYYQVGYDGIKNKGNYYNQGNLPDRISKFPIQIKPWKEDGEIIILHGQVKHGPGSQHIDVEEWVSKTISRLRERYPEKQLKFLPHPNANFTPKGVDFCSSLKESFENCYLSVTFNSNVVVNCLVNGIPSICDDDTSLAYPTFYQERKIIDRYDFLNKISFSEWHTSELKNGDMWEHLRPHAFET